MDRYLRLILKMPKTAIAILFGVTLIFAYGVTRLGFDNSVEALLPQNDDEYLFYNHTKEIFGDSGRFIILLISHEQLWSREAFQRIDDLVQDLEEYENYNEAREQERIEKVKALSSMASVACSRLMAAFAGDGVYLRSLKRHLGPKYAAEAILSRRDLQHLLQALQGELDFKRQKLVDRIVSPLTAKDISGQDNTLRTYDLVPKDDHGRRVLPATAEEFAAFKQKLLRNPAFESAIYAKDPKSGQITDFGMLITFVNMKDQDPIARHLCRLIQSHDRLKIVLHGMPYANSVFNDYMRRDLTRFLPFVMLVVVMVLFANFRSIRGVVLPLITLGMAAEWVLGLMGFLGVKLTAVGISLPPLMIAVGSSYAIHLLNQYYIDYNEITRKGVREGLVASASHISSTIFLAGLTTLVAFITLCTNQVAAIREWGIFSAIGVAFSVFIACTLIPAGISLLPHRPPIFMKRPSAEPTTSRIDIIDRFIAWIISMAVNHAKAVLAAVLVLIAISAIGLLRLNVESDFVQYFKADDPIRVAGDQIEEKLSGRWGFNILLDSGAPEGVTSPDFLNQVEAIRAWLVSDRNPELNVGRTDAFSDFIKTMHMAMNNDDPGAYAIPRTQEEIQDYLEIYTGEDKNSDGRIDEFEAYVDRDFRTINLMARFHHKQDHTLGTAHIQRILKAVDDHLNQTLPQPYSHRITGFPTMNVKMAQYIVAGQLQNLFSSFGIIALIVLLHFRSLKAALLSQIPMGVAVILSFGIMGWFQINLDIVTSIIAAITVGIGVDDTIHVLNTYQRFGHPRRPIAQTIEQALKFTGKAVIYTSLALIAGFSVLTVSSFKPVLLFGILMDITMTATTLGALVLLPAVLRLTRVDLSVSPSGFWSRFSTRWPLKRNAKKQIRKKSS